MSKSITINGNGSTISGTGLTIITATAAINNLNFVNTIAKGGDGGPGSGRGGGSGEGRVSVEACSSWGGANVTATNVTFQNDRAQGGNGGAVAKNSVFLAGGGGGGYRTDGQEGARFGDFGGHGGLPGGGDGGNAFTGSVFSTGPAAQPGGGGGGGQGLNRKSPGAAGGVLTEDYVLVTENSASLGARPRAGPPRVVSTSH